MSDHKFKTGNQASKGKGRPKGSPNKFNADLKAMILTALEKHGGAEYLAEQAKQNPTAFMALLGKVLPMTIQGGEGTSGKMVIRWES